MPHVEYGLLTLSEHIRSLPVVSEVRVVQCFVCLFVIFLLAVLLSVLRLLITPSVFSNVNCLSVG